MKPIRQWATLLLLGLATSLLLPTALFNGSRRACAAAQATPSARLQVGWRGFGDAEAVQRMTIFPRHIVPQTRVIHQPGALWIAVNLRALALLPGDRLELRDQQASRLIQITMQNESLAKQAWESASLWDHPFLMRGNRVTVTYWPSLRTLVLPIDRPQLDNAVAVIDSVTFGVRVRPVRRPSGAATATAPRKEADGDLESILGQTNDMTPAVCFRNCSPAIYKSSRAVARLIIRRNAEDPPQLAFTATRDSSSGGEPAANTWTFCTGWLVGRANHMLTNYHCFFDLARRAGAPVPAIQQSADRAGCRLGGDTQNDTVGSAPSLSLDDMRVAVNFNAEAATCNSSGRMGEPAGVIEASRVQLVAANERLDYCLLRVEPNASQTNLSKRYGYLTMRASGPVDGEPIYVPQHPNGQVKMITVTDDGKPAVIRVPHSGGSNASASSQWSDGNASVWHSADTAPGSSGSPVLSLRDNTVVALHHAGATSPKLDKGELNIAIRSDAIVADLRAKRALPACAVAGDCAQATTW
ncbi:hypothetical protein P43SY_011383 [Pythium insidiosum]|uniref:Serine protease n=1 Tax=Pythium insidiosum TaxID=114742 RepID=A0AAD5M0D2_PYTIN|nr:hypothetical protein P43SY_011383 [Pythium insidiosum]